MQLRSLCIAAACPLAAAATSVSADFVGWAAVSPTPQGDATTVALDLYALFDDDDDLLLELRDVTAILNNGGTFVHDDAMGGTWRPQSALSLEDSYLQFGGFAGPGNTTGFDTPPSPDQPSFPQQIDYHDTIPGGWQGQPVPLDFVELFGVQVARLVISPPLSDPCVRPTETSMLWNATVVYADGEGGEVREFSLSLGAYFAALPAPEADLTGDERVNGEDLGVLLSEWGPCVASCLGDLNGDDVVDAADLGMLLSAWDECP